MGLRRSCLILVLLLSPACRDDEVIERTPIEPFLLEYNDPVPACSFPQTQTIQVGAFVGHDGCDLESAEIQIQGDSLLVTGVARCVFRRIASPTTPPARKKPQWLMIRLPDLEPGDYTLCAGDLCGGLTVTRDCNAAVNGKLYASGTFYSFDSCTVFDTGFGARIYEARDVAPPLPMEEVRIFGVPWCSMPWCPEICNPYLDGVIQVLSLEVAPLPAGVRPRENPIRERSLPSSRSP